MSELILAASATVLLYLLLRQRPAPTRAIDTVPRHFQQDIVFAEAPKHEMQAPGPEPDATEYHVTHEEHVPAHVASDEHINAHNLQDDAPYRTLLPSITNVQVA